MHPIELLLWHVLGFGLGHGLAVGLLAITLWFG